MDKDKLDLDVMGDAIATLRTQAMAWALMIDSATNERCGGGIDYVHAEDFYYSMSDSAHKCADRLKAMYDSLCKA